ncbi:hypothetical protein [Candidatus Solirubrobacter pratensis]|uniref:hypothetical protein n=1 Tax=Candidatus Solirubrobacter pratensis TaxID=1298857 RepID=UPI00041F01EE|nr:hypothetical protein [Candidatus Solirubrobacter pratensis]
MAGRCESQSGIKISPGSKRRLCVPFEVPANRKVKTFQFTLDSGSATTPASGG